MAQSVTIASVWVGERYGAEYPAILRDMVRRHVSPTYALRFVCITDRPDELPDGMEAIEPEPGLPGWWQKLALFKPGKIPGNRIAYFDLDVVIINSIDAALDRPGIIKEWFRPGYNSSVMVWDAGDHAEAWTTLTPDDVGRLHGDQQKLDEIGGWETFPRFWCISHRAESTFWPPYDAKVVVFHGNPKPHEFTTGWIPMAWKIGGLTGLPTSKGINIPEDVLLEHVRSAVTRDLIWFTGAPDNDRECCIVGGGPSLKSSLGDLRARVAAGAALVSLNGSLRWLLNRGLTPSSHVMVDARAENIEFVLDLPRETTILIASQCHPDVFDMLAGHPHEKVILWHSGTSCEEHTKIINDRAGEEGALIVGGGSTVGLRAMFLAHLSGFHRLHLYGFDSCIVDDQHHAYEQALNDGDTRIEVVMAGNRYVCAPWMARQAQEFNGQHDLLVNEGARIEAHGFGLIPDICRLRNECLPTLETVYSTFDPIADRERSKYEKAWSLPEYAKVEPGVDVARCALDELGAEAGESIIDYGAGTGHAAAIMQELGLSVVAVDIADNCLDKGVCVPFVRAPLWDLPDDLSPSDWCFCCDVLEHIPEDKLDDVLSGIAIRTRRGGFLQPALECDWFGLHRVGAPLHLTVKPAEWWIEKVGQYFDVRVIEGVPSGRLAQLPMIVTAREGHDHAALNPDVRIREARSGGPPPGGSGDRQGDPRYAA